MSFKEVNNLRKAGRLDEALRRAESDLQSEKSHWTYSALFWVLRDYCNHYISKNHYQYALNVIQRMETLVDSIQDYNGVAHRTLQSLRHRTCPMWEEVNNLVELSKNGQEESAYTQICELNRNNRLSPLLHEDYGWIIYRYLKKCYDSCGSLNARRALHTYLQLNNSRPSELHSCILNLAIKISEKYKEFRFFDFLKIWNVEKFASKDLERDNFDLFDFDNFNGKKKYHLEGICLVERCIEHCVKLGYSIKEIKESLMINKEILEDDILFACSRFYFFKINNCKSEDEIFYKEIENYLSLIVGFTVVNEYHSKILTLFLWKLPENKDGFSVNAINKWGLNNFREEDWQREEKEEEVFPSLVEKVIKHYFAGLKNNSFRNVAPAFETLLEKACKKYDDDQLDRYFAILMLAKGDKEKALSIYRSLLLNLNRFYVWKELAEATDDIELKMSAYCKAIVSEPKDEFLGDIHLALAKLMIDGGFFREAKRELQTYAETYQNKGWRVKAEFSHLCSMIQNNVTATDSNVLFYNSHMASAEDFVYLDIDWTTMFIADIYAQKVGDKQEKKTKLVSVDGLSIAIKSKKLTASNNYLGKCYDVKIHSKDNRKEIVLIRESVSCIDQLLSPVVCYVDYHNKEKKCYHLVSENQKELLLSHAPVKLSEGAFCRCYEVPVLKEETHNDFSFYDRDLQNTHKKTRPSIAIFCDLIKKNEGIEKFPLNTAVVDGVNESKELFHCVFGRNSDIVIKFNQTTLRPHIGDYVKVRYIKKKTKEGKVFRKMLSVDFTDTCDMVLTKTVSGPIRLNYNSKGQLFGFVDDYYVPTHLVEGINEEELVCVDVVFNGEKWQAYNLVRYNEKQED